MKRYLAVPLDSRYLKYYPPYMEAYMELSHKTTILFSEDQFSSLKSMAKVKGKSVGELIRSACEQVYTSDTREGALNAVVELEKLDLPVSSVGEMKMEQVSFKEIY